MNEKFDVPEVHPNFKINKIHFTISDLRKVAYNYIKEGEPYEGLVGDFILDWVKPSLYLDVQTSGSTGKPKKLRIRKDHMINSALATGKFFELPEKSTVLLCLPANYIAGKMMIVRAMVLGWELDMVPPSSNPLDQVFKTYDFCAMTPFQLDNSLGRLHLIKKLIVGGGAVSPHLQNKVQDLTTKVYETFGMTETVSHIAAKRLNPTNKKNKPIPFKVLPDIGISTDERGCLVVKAPKVAEDIVVTNDVVEIVTYKKFFWKGRIDNVVNSGGVKLHPEEIELKLNETIDRRFFVTGLPDDALGEKLVLFVEADFSEELLAQLEEDIKNLKSLEKFEVPKKIYLVQKFEETPNGKIHRENTVKSRNK
ncbi:AMP-binding protein [Antarcticibacterium flavum]|uniref:AMP-binding protein n=1 Tax=Antarcticibacterium flavum TaxID=2058175 RepID=A0A5B7X617_9FLAO|nr:MULTISPECIES: AMP-binding protein [Antarcticibacterium]MCM4159599.1 O-succinylbenzoic acid--CoA ligase [Antarcticibacterium sp. W02-3]QCY70847.1 AMP-binding protein [Antarcticibacterium flavum]